MNFALTILDIFLDVLHLTIIAINGVGWLIPRWRMTHAVVIHVTAISWLGVGLVVGNIGYCFLTDWQWQVKSALGEGGLSSSYIVYVFQRFFGVTLSRTTADFGAATVFVVSLVAAWRFLYTMARERGLLSKGREPP